MRTVLSAIILLGAVCACEPAPAPEVTTPEPGPEASTPRTWTFEQGSLFPAARGLSRAEDGVVLADGRIVVADQNNGLTVIAKDGATRPFGKFAAAGYVHALPASPAGPNGVTLEPDGAHLLVADVFTGAIYRVNIETEATQKVYAHAFGVNTAVSDSTGAIWFTQSTENPAGPDTETRLLVVPMTQYVTDGALFRIAPASPGGAPPAAQRVLGGLGFANSIVIDEKRGQLYLSETMADQVTGYRISVADGTLSDRRVVASVLSPDNIEMDEQGRLWAASPVHNEVVTINPETGETRSVFRAQTAANDRSSAEWQRRSKAREPLIDLFTPDLWAPMPGLLTGVILTPGGGPIYVSGLGDALVKLEP
jgi:sugar lactone lactonase YvrE